MANPRAVQVSIAIGSDENAVFLQNVNNNQMTSLTHTRYAGEQGNKLVASFFDQTAFDIETRLLFLGNALQDRTIFYQYGYSYSLGSMSRLYAGIIYDYTPSISGNTTTIQIHAVSRESTTMFNTKAKNYNVLGGPIRVSEIVKTIAAENGWVVGEIETTTLTDESFVNSFISPMEYINTRLIPYAVSQQTGLGFYSAYFTTNLSGRTVINFKSMVPGDTSTRTYTYIQSTDKFTYNSPLSEVLSWSPTAMGSYLLYGGGFVESNAITNATGDIYTTRSSALVNPNGTSNKTWLSKNSFTQLHQASAERDASHNAVQAAYSKARLLQYNAQCTMIGDVNRQVGETVEFNIILQNKIHYSSGKYLVLGVEDSISNSGFTTSLDLVKNASMAGSRDTTILR
jgi:hypothetical protein